LIVSIQTLRVALTFVTSTSKAWNCYRLERLLNLNRSSVQSSLETLESNGWIADTPVDNTTNRFRHAYLLTEKGLIETWDAVTSLQPPSTSGLPHLSFLPSRASTYRQLGTFA
jgi:hypothetical protein